MRLCSVIALLFLLMCVVSCSGEASQEQKHISAGAEFIEKSAGSIIGRYYSIGKQNGQPASLQVLHIKSFTKDRVVYDLVEYEFNPKPSDLETMQQLGAVSVLDPNPQATIQRRQDRLPRPYVVTGIKGVEKIGVEASLTMEKPNEKALPCYCYIAMPPQELVFEFCENGYRGGNWGVFRHQGDYESKLVISEWGSVVSEILAANPGFPGTMPNKSAVASAKLEHQDVTIDIQYDGEIIGSAAFCMGNKGLFSDEEASKVGLTYINWLRMKYSNAYMEQFFYIFKEALLAGEKAQQQRGMQDCDKHIAAFDELAKIIGYQRPEISTK